MTTATQHPAQQAGTTPTPAATVPEPVPFVVKRKTKRPPRRIYGDDFTETYVTGHTADGEPIEEQIYPHYREWVEFLGSMTGEMYLETLNGQKLEAEAQAVRARAEVLQERIEQVEEAGAEPSDADKAALESLQQEMVAVAEQVEAKQLAVHKYLADSIVRLAWTHEDGTPVGTPTGEVDEEGNQICTVIMEDITGMPVRDIGWLNQASFGAMGVSERGKD